MKIAERIVMVLLLFVFIGAGAWLYFAVKYEQENPEVVVEEETLSEKDWERIYPYTVELFIGTVPVRASVADDLKERIEGLSNTPFLPDNVVKLFVFGVNGEHSIWMKDMNYSIDIIWATEEGEIVHIVENATPESYPESFAPPTPAWYVIETSAGFVKKNSIEVGQKMMLP